MDNEHLALSDQIDALRPLFKAAVKQCCDAKDYEGAESLEDCHLALARAHAELIACNLRTIRKGLETRTGINRRNDQG